ncbi:DNA/RNA nuclease SfsA [Pigmentibacter ruber]|nr:DNA/RNA nuclease SfsA [Pigmentibacter ruber]
MEILSYQNSLEEVSFLSRYKRFFVDVKDSDGNLKTVHCANSGSMKSCLIENSKAYILDSKNSERKLQYSLELLYLEDGFACLNTSRANHFINELFSKIIANEKNEDIVKAGFPYDLFCQWDNFKKEVKFNSKTRFDFCLSAIEQKRKCWIEVKSVSLKLSEDTWAFPDAVTERGQKHLQELMLAKSNGDDSWLFFVLMRGSLIEPQILKNGFRIAHEIDPKYSKLLTHAKKIGVKIALIIPGISPSGFSLRKFYLLD